MTGRKGNTSPGWVDPDEAPEWTDEVFERAAVYEGDALIKPAKGTLTRRGRPKLAHPKRQVTLRLDSDVLDNLRNSGPGWQSRVNAILRDAMKAGR